MCDRSLDSIDNPRLVRIKEKTLLWDFKFIHVPGIKQEATDAISRIWNPKFLFTLQVSGLMDVDDMATLVKGKLIATINSVNSAQELTVITLPMVQKATEEDGVLVKLVEEIGKGFPES